MTAELALLGGTPRFDHPIELGQGYFPSWERYEAVFRDLFARQYYTNHGPLAARLETRLAELLDVKHAMYMTNATIAMMIGLDALEVNGKVIVPAYASPGCAQAVRMSGREPLFCDVNGETHQLDATAVEPLLGPDVAAILAVNLAGDACDVAGLEALAQRRGVRLFFDSSQAFACRIGNRPLGGFGALEVFSFHISQVLSTSDGACLCTNDDEVAAQVRNIRCGYGIGRVVPVTRTSNGRMSEAQAAIGHLQLEDLSILLERNRALYAAYRRHLQEISGLRLVEPRSVDFSNHQAVVCEVDASVFGLSRDRLLSVLQAENVLARGPLQGPPGLSEARQLESRPAFPNAERVRERVLRLPIGANVEQADIATIADIIRQAHASAAYLGDRLQ